MSIGKPQSPLLVSCGLLLLTGLFTLPAEVFADAGNCDPAASSLTWVMVLLGKLHPAAVHFPIALLVVAALFEVKAWITKDSLESAFARRCVLIAIPACIAAGLFGWLNAECQSFYGSLEDKLFLHRWIGIGVTAGTVVCFFLIRSFEKTRAPATLLAYRVLLILSAGAVGFTGHLGGLLVHGEDYYADLFDSNRSVQIAEAGKASLSSSENLVKLASFEMSEEREISFADDVFPIFEETCAKCHLGGRFKGDYQLDSAELAMQTGESGLPPIVPGKADESYLIHLVAGLVEDSVMPKKGRKLTTEEVALLRAWIDQGAPWGEVETKEFPKADFRHRLVDVPVDEAHPVDALLKQASGSTIDLSNTISDREFYRRVSLDLLGLVPSFPSVDAFASDTSADKYERLIERLMDQRHDYAAHWLSFWNDALRNDYTGAGFLHGGRKEITGWLYSALRRNLRFDDFVKQLVNPEGKMTAGFTKGILWWEDAEPDNIVEHPAMQAAQSIGQVFLGINLKCASCHDSFTDPWKMSDAFAIANVYADRPLEVHRCNQPTGKFIDADFPIPVMSEPIQSATTKRLAENFWINPPKYQKTTSAGGRKELVFGKEVKLRRKARKERMEQFAERIASPENGRLARTFVNRMWSRLFGRGIVEPLDEMDQEPWSAELLDYLAAGLVERDFDVQAMLKLIMTSKAYRLKTVSMTPEEIESDEFSFRGPLPKRLTAEQLIDSLYAIADMEPSVSVSEIERISRISQRHFPLPGSNLADSSGGPTLLFESEVLNREKPTQSVSFEVTGHEHIWIAALPKFGVKSRVEELAAQHRAVVDQERAEIVPKSEVVAQQRAEGEAFLQLGREQLDKLYLKNAAFLTRESRAISLSDLPLRHTQTSYGDIIREENLLLHGDKEGGYGIGAAPFFAFSVRIPKGASEFKADFGLTSLPKEVRLRYQLIAFSDFEFRSAFRERDALMTALGRPRREQVSTRREQAPTALQMLELASGEEFSALCSQIAGQLLKKYGSDPAELIELVFSRALSRMPTERERVISSELFASLDTGLALEDLLWSVALTPEFQYVS